MVRFPKAGKAGAISIHLEPHHPQHRAGSFRVAWNFAAGDNGGAGWTNHTAQALVGAGWHLSQTSDAKTFVDTTGSFDGASGLMWVRDWQQANTISADYQFDYLPAGRLEWRMGTAGSGNQFRLYNGHADENGLMVLGIQMVDSDTVRILSEPTATRDRDFPGVNFGQMHTWRWDWISDPDGVNGIADLSFQRDDGSWEWVYSSRAFDANVVPDTFWLESVGDLSGSKYVVLDSLAAMVLPPLNGIAGDLNQDGVLDSVDEDLFVAGWKADTTLMTPFTQYYHGDLNFDGVTNLADAYQLHLAMLASGAGGFDFRRLVTVPEPSGLLLIGIGVVVACCRRSDFRQRQP